MTSAVAAVDPVHDDPPHDDPLPRHGWHLLAVLGTLMAFASISTDLYLPAMPAMARALAAPPGTTEWTISGYLIGFGIGQLFWGPIGDAYGRRGPVAIGIVLFAIGSAGCALSGSIGAVIGWRLVQALGASAGVTLGRAMVRDLYRGRHAARMMSTLMTIMAIAPLLGPILGGQILALAGWRMIFWTLVGVAVVTMLALSILPETLPAEERSSTGFAVATRRYGQLLADRRVRAYAAAGGFFYAGTFASVAGTPFAYIDYHHVPPQYYGLLFGVGIVGIMATNLLNARLVGMMGVDRLLRLGCGIAALAGIAAAIDAVTGWGGLAGLAIPIFVFVGATGFIVANAITGALALYPSSTGAMSALVGAAQYGSGVIGSALVGAFVDGTPAPMGIVMALCGVGAWLSTRGLRHGRARG